MYLGITQALLGTCPLLEGSWDLVTTRTYSWGNLQQQVS